VLVAKGNSSSTIGKVSEILTYLESCVEDLTSGFSGYTYTMRVFSVLTLCVPGRVYPCFEGTYE
jgi:hypothetical protein